MSSSRRSILFLCVANSARSQMAEGLAPHDLRRPRRRAERRQPAVARESLCRRGHAGGGRRPRDAPLEVGRRRSIPRPSTPSSRSARRRCARCSWARRDGSTGRSRIRRATIRRCRARRCSRASEPRATRSRDGSRCSPRCSTHLPDHLHREQAAPHHLARHAALHKLWLDIRAATSSTGPSQK